MLCGSFVRLQSAGEQHSALEPCICRQRSPWDLAAPLAWATEVNMDRGHAEKRQGADQAWATGSSPTWVV